MAIIKCKMCGGDLVIEPGSTVAECEYCGSRQTVPTADNEKKMVQFERAERLRKNCEFDKAAGIYESIVSEFRTESEAYWGLFLCKYGIEYVDDPATGKKIPTCHRSSFDSVMEDSDFEQALENADIVARKVYREEAKQIEEIRKGIIEVSGREQPYDIFICYKETDENGQRTIDSAIAQDVYDALTAKDYRVFFSRITLEDKLGQEYEPYIFAALNSAKIMLAFGTDYEYFNAVWVKNEWSRFLKLMASDKSKHLIPCYKNIDAYDMPREFAKLQAQDMGKVGAVQDLLRGIAKLMPKQEQETAAVTEAVPGAGAMVMRGQFALDDGDFQKAAEFFERALDQNPQDGSAYLGKVLAALHVSSARQLEDYYLQIRDDKDFDRAIRFSYAAASDSLQKILDQSHRKYLLKCVVTGICKYARMREKTEKLEAQRIALEKQRELERIEQERREEEARIARKKREEEERIAWEKSNRRLKPIRERLRKAAYLMDASFYHTVGLKVDGTVVSTGSSKVGNWRDIVQVSVGGEQTVGLKADGTVEYAGGFYIGQSDLFDWRDIVQVSAASSHTVGLKADGTVVVAGFPHYGTYDVSGWRDIVQVSAGSSHIVGLKADGTVVATGTCYNGQDDVSDWRDIVAVSAGGSHTVGLKADGTVVATKYIISVCLYHGQCDVSDWRDIVAVSAGDYHTVGLKSDGTVVATKYTDDSYCGQCDVSDWRDIVAVSAGGSHTVGLKADGTLVAAGRNNYGACNVSDWRLFQQLDTLEQESIDARAALQKWEEEVRIARQKQEEERIARERREDGLCQHCGGEFKGLFKKTCTACGKPKDY